MIPMEQNGQIDLSGILEKIWKRFILCITDID